MFGFSTNIFTFTTHGSIMTFCEKTRPSEVVLRVVGWGGFPILLLHLS